MKRHYTSHTFADNYKDLLMRVLTDPEYIVSPRGQDVHEICDCTMTFNPRSNAYINDRRSSQFQYIAAELIWYFSGEYSNKFIKRYAKFWETIQNADGTANSAYGYQLFTRRNSHGLSSWEWALQQLVSDSDTRQAIMHISEPEHQKPGIKDFPCTLTCTFMIRDNHLNMSVHMRSNDVILGLPTDIAFFTVLQQQMLRHIRKTDACKDVQLGTYTHKVDSMHLYQRNFWLAEVMINHDFEAVCLPELDVDLIHSDSTPTSGTSDVQLYANNKNADVVTISEAHDTSSEFVNFLLNNL